MTSATGNELGSKDPRARQIWSNFTAQAAVADHFARASARFAGKPAWSLIVPIESDAVTTRAKTVQDAVSAGFGAQPVERLHITLFTLPVEPPPGWQETVSDITERMAPFDLHIGGVNAFPESIFLEVDDPTSLRALRETLRAGCGWIEGGVPAEFYLPHISVVYFKGQGPAPTLPGTLEPLRGLSSIQLSVHSLLASRLEFGTDGRSRRVESTEFALGRQG